MAYDGSYPTSAESWALLAVYGEQLHHNLPAKLREAMKEVLNRRWVLGADYEPNIHNFSLVWPDLHYRALATKLANGPGAEVFKIGVLNKLKVYRLDGYWNALLDNGTNWSEMAFGNYESRVPLADFSQIVFCAHQKVGETYKTELNRLFWRGDEPFKAINRAEGFLALLPYTAYVEAYSFSTNNPPDPKWNFPKIMEEIQQYGANAKLIMLHVSFWYNIDLREPGPRQLLKDPIYYHLKRPFCEMLSQGLHEITEQEWKAKAIALQQIVLDFMKSNYKMLKGPPVSGTLKFYHTADTADTPNYCTRFVPGTFWDLLAREIRREMPDLPFIHPGLQRYNSPDENIHHTHQGGAPRITADSLPLNSPGENIHHTHQDGAPKVTADNLPLRRESCMGDLAAGEGGKVLEQTSNLIGEEYGSDISSVGDCFDVECRASIEALDEHHSKESTNVHSESGRHGLQNDDFDADDDVSTVIIPQSSAQTYTTMPCLGKRKTSIIKPDPDSGEVDPFGHLPADAPWETNHINRRPSKIIKLKFASYKITKTATPKEPAPSNIAPRPSKTGKRDVNFFRGQVQQNYSPSEASQEHIFSTVMTADVLVSNQAADSTWRNGSQSSRNSPMLPNQNSSPIDPIPPPRRRQRMMTNLPASIFSTTPPTTEPSTTTNLSSQSPAPSTTRVYRRLSQLPRMSSSSIPSVQEKGGEADLESHGSESSCPQSEAKAPEASQGSQTPQPTQAPPSRPRTPLSKVERALELVQEEFTGRLTMAEEIAAINAVSNENKAVVYLMLKRTDHRNSWLLSEIGKKIE